MTKAVSFQKHLCSKVLRKELAQPESHDHPLHRNPNSAVIGSFTRITLSRRSYFKKIELVLLIINTQFIFIIYFVFFSWYTSLFLSFPPLTHTCTHTPFSLYVFTSKYVTVYKTDPLKIANQFSDLSERQSLKNV